MNWHHHDQKTTLAEANAVITATPVEQTPRPRRAWTWPENGHKVNIGLAREFIERRRRAAQVGGAAFEKSAIERVLNQTGCAGMRIYYGMKEDGLPCLIGVGVDQQGEEMLDGELLEYAMPCPPFCPKGPSLGRAR